MNTQNLEQSADDVSLIAIEPDTYKEAYERCLPEIRAVRDEELVAPNLDVHASVTTIIGALPEIQAFRSEMGRVPQLDHRLLDALEDYAKATAEAHSQYTTAITPQADIQALNEAAAKQRDQLRTDAEALAKRGLVNPERLANIKGLVGYKNVAFDLMDYANILRDAWDDIAGKTPVTFEEIHAAKALGARLVQAAGLREQAPIVAAEAAKIRQQALTLLVKAYDEARRAIIFLRWREDDADTIAPSLYAGRGGSKKRTEHEVPDEQPANPTEPPAAPNGTTPVSGIDPGMPQPNPLERVV